MTKQSKLATALQIAALVTLLNAPALAKRKPANQNQQRDAIIQMINQNAGKGFDELDWLHKGIFPPPYISPIKNNVIPHSMRSAVLLNGSTLDNGVNRGQFDDGVPSVLLLGNVRHKTADGADKIYVAEIPWTSITAVEIQKQQMSVVSADMPGAAEINSLVAHARIKFTFGTPIRLMKEIQPAEQSADIVLVPLREPIEQETLSLSAEALTDRYNFVDGVQNRFAFGHFFQTESIPTGNGGGELTEYPVNIDTKLMKTIFLETIITSQLNDRDPGQTPTYKNTYNVVSNNCITATFELLKRAGYQRKACGRDAVDAVLDALPTTAEGAPRTLTPEIRALLEEEKIPADVAQAVAAELYSLRSRATGEGSTRHYPDVWVATRIPCWLGLPSEPRSD